MKLFKLIFLLLIYLHCFGCFWFLLVTNTGNGDEWMPPLDYVWVETDLYYRPISYQYWNCIYHSVLVLTGNDIGPRGFWQVLVCLSFVLCGAFINANIFGELAVVLASMNEKQTKFAEQIDTANTTMSNLSLAPALQKKVIDYMHSTMTA